MTRNLTAMVLVAITSAIVAQIIVIIIMWLTMQPARAELCLPAIDNTIEKRSGFRWQWRMVEGDPRKCWFYSNTLLPKEDLIWSYRSREFDADVRVIERRYYFPETMELKRFEIAPGADDGR
jgi:hypothetical protein